jgi:hypothetical protein
MAADAELLDPTSPVAPVESPFLDPDDDPLEAPQPVTHGPAAVAEPQWPMAPIEPEWPVAPVAPAWRSPSAPPEQPAAGDAPSPAEASVPPSATRSVAAQPAMAPSPGLAVWPPAGGAAPLPAAAIRTPAGAYLTPSAVLPPLDAPNAGSGHPADSGSDSRGTVTGKARVASLAESLDALGITGDAPRRVIGLGAAMAALGFLLPWAEVVIGSGLAGSYWARWGMAGPGHWIIVAALVALAVLGLARSDRLSELRLGLPAVGLGALLVGLVWPYLFGVIGHAVGVWLVLFGAIVLAVGGLLDFRRHATATPDV